jgi:hypothetical protein
MTASTVQWLGTINIKQGTFKKTGYHIKGWNVKRETDGAWYCISDGWLTTPTTKKLYPNGNSTDYQFNSGWTTGLNGNETFTFYAVWEPNTYTVKYNANGGTGTMTDTTVNYNNTITFRKNTFTKAGYKFIGWNLKRDYDNKWVVSGVGWKTEEIINTNSSYKKHIYMDEASMAFESSWIAGAEDNASSFTLYAVWEIEGNVRIYVDGEWKIAIPYIYNGTEWKQTVPYIYNGTEWKQCGG